MLTVNTNTATLMNDTAVNEKFEFKRYFFNSRLRNKFFIIIFLPFVPIYTVSHYFYEKGKLNGKNPSLKKYIAIISILYVMTFYPLVLGLIWVELQVVFFPLSFCVAYYYHKRGYKEDSEEEEKQSTTTMMAPRYKETFTIEKFNKLSITFLVLLVCTLVLSDFFLFFIFAFLSVVLVLFPKFYEKPLGIIPQRLLILSNPILGFFSFLPGLDFKGTWFMLHEPQSIKLKSILDLMKFIGRNMFPFFIMNAGITALIIRIVFWLRGDPSHTTIGSIFASSAIAYVGYLLAFELVPIILAVYFVWIWTWQDAGLRIAIMKNRKRYRRTQTTTTEEEILLIKDPTSSIKYLFALIFGLPSITWLATKIVEESASAQSFFNSTIDLFIILLVFFFVSGTAIIFMGVMYYRSGYHEKNVSNLRNLINSLDETSPYLIARYQPILKPINNSTSPTMSPMMASPEQNSQVQEGSGMTQGETTRK